MFYIDGFVIAVPAANKQKFIEHAQHVDALFTEQGASRHRKLVQRRPGRQGH